MEFYPDNQRSPPPGYFENDNDVNTESEGNDNQQASSMRKRQEQRQIEKNRLLQEQINNLKNIVWGFQEQYRKARELLEKLEREAQKLSKLDALALVSEAEQQMNQAKRRKQQNITMPSKRRRMLRVHGKQFVAPNKL